MVQLHNVEPKLCNVGPCGVCESCGGHLLSPMHEKSPIRAALAKKPCGSGVHNGPNRGGLLVVVLPLPFRAPQRRGKKSKRLHHACRLGDPKEGEGIQMAPPSRVPQRRGKEIKMATKALPSQGPNAREGPPKRGRAIKCQCNPCYLRDHKMGAKKSK